MGAGQGSDGPSFGLPQVNSKGINPNTPLNSRGMMDPQTFLNTYGNNPSATDYGTVGGVVNKALENYTNSSGFINQDANQGLSHLNSWLRQFVLGGYGQSGSPVTAREAAAAAPYLPQASGLLSQYQNLMDTFTPQQQQWGYAAELGKISQPRLMDVKY
jgi:hypothetical protein